MADPTPRDHAPDLSRYDAVLIDLDGTLYREEHGGPRVLPGAAALVTGLRSRGQAYACLTNSGASPRQLAARLAEMGAGVDESHIWSCAAAAAEHVLQRWGKDGRRPTVFNCSTDGLDDLLTGKVDWTDDERAACDVVISAAPVNRWATQERQWRALQLLRNGAALVGLCADRVYPSDRGLEFGAGALTQMLAYASGVAPTFCGKPDALFFRELCARLGVAPGRCLLVGDNLESDVAGAKGVGMASALVLTGVATRADVARLPEVRRPEFVIEDLTALR